MTKTTGVFLALLVVGIAVTTGQHAAKTHATGPVCPATSSSAATTASTGHKAPATGR